VRGGGRTHVEVDDGRGGVRGYCDAVDALEDRADRADVFLQRAEDRGCVAQDVDALRGGDGEERWEGGGEDEGGAVDTLVVDDDA